MHRLAASLLSACILVSVGPPASAQLEKPEPAEPGHTTYMINIALVIASEEGGSGLEPLPAPVAKAIRDIKDFLPYAHYEMHDSAVVRTERTATIRVDLEGPDARYYAAMDLRDKNEPGKLRMERFTLVRLQPEGQRRGKTVEDKQPNPSREVIGTTFSVKPGEPIVVGTSRLDGSGKALVVILTVLPAQ